ncbi:MAG: hypothetical protein KJN99_05955 [Marinicaulis sp.]|nr:hypothetical protein [Marinicaulis sp.]
MFGKPSLLTRITVAKLAGFALGVWGFFALPAYGVDDMRLRIGFLFWYVSIGAFIAIAGVMTYHPLLKLRMPWWFIGPWIGAWMNFILIMFAWDNFASLMAQVDFMGLTSPWWGVVEGAVVGLVLGGLATLFGGEGPETARGMG